MSASLNGQKEIVKLLLSVGAIVTEEDKVFFLFLQFSVFETYPCLTRMVGQHLCML